MITLTTRYGTKVEYDSLVPQYIIINYNNRKVRVLEEDFDEASQVKIEKIKSGDLKNETKSIYQAG